MPRCPSGAPRHATPEVFWLSLVACWSLLWEPQSGTGQSQSRTTVCSIRHGTLDRPTRVGKGGTPQADRQTPPRSVPDGRTLRQQLLARFPATHTKLQLVDCYDGWVSDDGSATDAVSPRLMRTEPRRSGIRRSRPAYEPDEVHTGSSPGRVPPSASLLSLGAKRTATGTSPTLSRLRSSAEHNCHISWSGHTATPQ
jgi:hypothetical protein